MTRLRGTILAAVPLLLLTACAQTAGNPAAGAPSSAGGTAPGADELVIRAERTGGFVPLETVAGALPMVSVYGDGRVITEGPVPAIYPGPALPNVQVTMVTPELVQELVRQGLAAGVRNGADFGRPNVADAPATRVTVAGPDGTQVVSVEALAEAPSNDPILTAGQRAARAELAKYVATVSGLSAAEGMPRPVAYDPARLAVLARPWTDPKGAGDNPAKAWPGPALPGEVGNATAGTGCTVVTGAPKDQVLAAAKTASAITPWTHGGKRWSVTFRPLLPEEQGCAALGGKR
jgi:hypothetical protein